MTVTLDRFFRGLKKLGMIVKGAPFVPSGLAFLFPNSKQFSDLYPPLGGLQHAGMVVTNIFLVIAPLLVFVYCRRKRKISAVAYIVLFSALVIFTGIFAWTSEKYVLHVPIDATNQIARVSIGFTRIPLVNDADSQKTDYELLRKVGPWEPEIKELWTSNSIATVRLTLLFSYTMMLVCASSLMSFIVYQHVVQDDQGQAPRPSSSTPREQHLRLLFRCHHRLLRPHILPRLRIRNGVGGEFRGRCGGLWSSLLFGRLLSHAFTQFPNDTVDSFRGIRCQDSA